MLSFRIGENSRYHIRILTHNQNRNKNCLKFVQSFFSLKHTTWKELKKYHFQKGSYQFRDFRKIGWEFVCQSISIVDMYVHHVSALCLASKTPQVYKQTRTKDILYVKRPK